MKHYSVPNLLVNKGFRDIELLSRAIGWDLDFRQIDQGTLNARAILFGHLDIGVLRAAFRNSATSQS